MVGPWLRRLVAGLSLRKSALYARQFHVGIKVNKVALEQVCLRVLLVSPVSDDSAIPSTIHNRCNWQRLQNSWAWGWLFMSKVVARCAFCLLSNCCNSLLNAVFVSLKVLRDVLNSLFKKTASTSWRSTQTSHAVQKCPTVSRYTCKCYLMCAHNKVRVSQKLFSTQLIRSRPHYVQISHAKFNRMSKVWTESCLRSEVKYGFYFTDFHETCCRLILFTGISCSEFCQNRRESVENTGNSLFTWRKGVLSVAPFFFSRWISCFIWRLLVPNCTRPK